MGKKKKRPKNPEITKKTETEVLNNDFLKNLLSILPLVILLIISFNAFVFYYRPSENSLVFLYGLFANVNFGFLYDLLGNGDLIILSAIFVATVLGFMILITKNLDNTTAIVLSIYASISSVFFTGAPSILYTKLLNNELDWTGYLFVEYFWEFIAFYFILNAAIKFYNSKKVMHEV